MCWYDVVHVLPLLLSSMLSSVDVLLAIVVGISLLLRWVLGRLRTGLRVKGLWPKTSVTCRYSKTRSLKCEGLLSKVVPASILSPLDVLCHVLWTRLR